MERNASLLMENCGLSHVKEHYLNMCKCVGWQLTYLSSRGLVITWTWDWLLQISCLYIYVPRYCFFRFYLLQQILYCYQEYHMCIHLNKILFICLDYLLPYFRFSASPARDFSGWGKSKLAQKKGILDLENG